ncbi:CBO0543 family protein [Bacillus albus]|uniref:CBO0543 family protein n=1 Tax=Bacillus albus TaxID=2026189 RepID=UPI003D238FAF
MDKLQKTIVKRSKKLNSPFLQRKTSFFEKKNNLFALVITILFSSIIGTCLDAFFVAKQIYSFPVRPFSSIFSVNIGFTLFVLPILTTIFIQISKTLSAVSRILFIISIGICASIFEQVAERFGLFIHSVDWNHTYSLFGYMIFFSFIWKLYHFMINKKEY